MDTETTVQQLKELVQRFCEERDWDRFHNPKDLAIGLITEASELLEYFRFKSEKEAYEMLTAPAIKREIAQEMSDVLYFLLRMAQKYDIDLAGEFLQKMRVNELKYPIEAAKGSNMKSPTK